MSVGHGTPTTMKGVRSWCGGLESRQAGLLSPSLLSRHRVVGCAHWKGWNLSPDGPLELLEWLQGGGCYAGLVGLGAPG